MALSALPMHPAGLASAGQVDSSSEETSSSSDETDVEVIAPHPQELPLHTLISLSQEPDFTDKWDQISSASVSGCLGARQVGSGGRGVWRALAGPGGGGPGAAHCTLGLRRV